MRGGGLTRILEEEPGGFFEAASGVEQEIVFAGNFNAHAEIVVSIEIVDNHVREMVHVDDDFVDAKGAKASERDFEECAARDFDEGFGARVGERAQARAEASGEDHGFHGKTSDEWRVPSGKKKQIPRCARNDNSPRLRPPEAKADFSLSSK